MPPFQPDPPMVCGGVGFICQQVCRVRQGIAQNNGTFDVGAQARRQTERQTTTVYVTYGVNLGVAVSLYTADGLNKGPLFRHRSSGAPERAWRPWRPWKSLT